MEGARDRDFLETVDGLLFCVVGYLHPPDRVTAYLKYVPEEGGKWSRGETGYTRVLPYYHVSQVENTYEYLREEYPNYLYHCPIRNITISSVPKEDVETHFQPRKRLASIIEEGPKDDLEYRLRDLVTILTGLSGLRLGDLGVTGSILTGSHSPEFSDMDLTVYGAEASLRLKEALLDMREEQSTVQPFTSAKKELWSRGREERFPLSFAELMEFAERRWNYGIFMDTYFSVHPVRTYDEISEEYGDRTYRQLGPIHGRGVITDASESIYLPALYGVEDVRSEDPGGLR